MNERFEKTPYWQRLVEDRSIADAVVELLNHRPVVPGSGFPIDLIMSPKAAIRLTGELAQVTQLRVAIR